MLRELLESAGITATTFNAGLGSTAQWDPATGVAKVAVLPDDVEHAQEIIRSSGVVPGPGPERPIEIPEKEWRASALTDQRETPDTIAYQVDCIRHIPTTGE